ncbi:hypothetical protein [Candidatus Nitrospira salsa]
MSRTPIGGAGQLALLKQAPPGLGGVRSADWPGGVRSYRKLPRQADVQIYFF